MKTRILLSFLFAVLFPVLACAQSVGGPAGGPGSPTRGGQSSTTDKYTPASSRDGDVSPKLPFNFLNGLYMSRCMESVGQEEFDSAIEACSKAIELDPGNIFAHRLRGLAYARKGDPQKVARDCEAAEKLGDGECRSWIKQAAQKGGVEDGKLTLLCRVSFAGSPPKDWPLVVDLASGTVNGWKASINDNMIRWSQKGAWFTVDRYSGTLNGANTDKSATYTGKCVKTEGERQF